MFCEKLPFDSLFSSEFCIFLVGFLCILKIYHVRLYILEKMGFGTAPRQYGIHSKFQPLLQKTCLFYVSKTLAAYAGVFLYTHALAHVCKLLPMYMGQGPLWLFNFQKQIFAHLKGYIFDFNTSQVNLISDQALNQPQALEFGHYQETEAQVIRGTNAVHRCTSFDS